MVCGHHRIKGGAPMTNSFGDSEDKIEWLQVVIAALSIVVLGGIYYYIINYRNFIVVDLICGVIPSTIAVLFGFMVLYFVFTSKGIVKRNLQRQDIQKIETIVDNSFEKYTSNGLLFPLVSNEEIFPENGEQVIDYQDSIFISSPMAGYDNNQKYTDYRTLILNVRNVLVKEKNAKNVIYAGSRIETINDFEDKGLSLQMVYRYVQQCKSFILIYPEKVASSVFLEVGWAIAMRKPLVLFVRDRDDLPFLLGGAGDANLERIRIIEFKDEENLLSIIRTTEDLFPI